MNLLFHRRYSFVITIVTCCEQNQSLVQWIEYKIIIDIPFMKTAMALTACTQQMLFVLFLML
jgi:hypothetical protein